MSYFIHEIEIAKFFTAFDNDIITELSKCMQQSIFLEK